MPTRPPPALKHKSLDRQKSERKLEAALRPQLEKLLQLSGFLDEYGIKTLLEFSNEAVINEAKAHFAQLMGTLVNAAVVRVDAGFKPNSKIRSTLRAVERNPSLMFVSNANVEPEAAGLLASLYQRDQEVAGTHWYDVLESGIKGVQPAKGENISQAARRAIGSLSDKSAKTNRSTSDLTGGIASRNSKKRNFGAGTLSLATNLRKWITTFSKKPIRLVYPAQDGDSRTLSTIDVLIEILLPPLNKIVSAHGAKEFKASTLIKEISARP